MILKINSISINSYQMWYQHKKSLKFKVFMINGTIVSPTTKITYECECCNNINETILRTFNDRVALKYDNFQYVCFKCVRSNKHLSDSERKKKSKIQKEKEFATKMKNGTHPKQKVERGESFGFVGKDQTKNSEIRNKMDTTKLVNDSNTKKGTDAYYKRQKTYKSFDEERKILINTKQYNTKLKNGTHPKQKAERGDAFGFVNPTDENLKVFKDKIIKKFYTLVEDAYHLDHRFSIKEGFLNNILPYYIGNIKNLEMIHHKENCSKQSTCSLTLDRLLDDVVNKGGELLETP